METIRRGHNVTQGNTQQTGRAAALTRILVGAIGALALCILLTASSASAKTVYPYEYAGFFDGTGSTKGQFKSELAGIDYWPTGQLKTATSPDGSTLTYTYDTAHRLTDVTDAVNNKIHYDLDDDGNRATETVSDSSGLLAAAVYRVFDLLSRTQSTTGAAN